MRSRDGAGFVPIEAYAAIGDSRSVALVAADGRVDWWPTTHPDAPPSFGAILDPAGGGYIALAPTEPFTASRRYLPGTNVLETTYTTGSGSVRILDAVSFGRSGNLPWSELVRRVEGLDGEVELSWVTVAGNQFGRAEPRLVRHEDGWIFEVGEEQLALRLFDVEILEADGPRVAGRLVARPGLQSLLAVVVAVRAPVFLPSRGEIERHLEITIDRWESWSGSMDYDGRWQEQVERSGLVLKLLTCIQTGAILAAPTTSLPERMGGTKNWDYRFMWVRDSSFTIDALLSLGLHDEAQAAVQWLLAALASTEPDLHVFYRVNGDAADPEFVVPIPGYRHSKPVREGNGASQQLQLGTFGDLFDAMAQYVEDGHRLDPASGRMLAGLANRCCDLWMSEDSGIWELQTKRHYTVSKVGCWTALDRAIRLHERGQLPGDDLERWTRTREQIRHWVETNCWSERKQSYTFYAGTDDLDAATLLVGRTGFAHGERLAGTIRAIQAELAEGPYVYRYSGAADEEGAFVACTFWLVNALVIAGDLDAAADLMDRAMALTNDLGLMAEEIDAETGELLGNFPQGLSHLALINAACSYESARSGRRDP